MLKSLEDHMNEKQHHLNESSSARLGRSQKLEILPSPNTVVSRRRVWAPIFGWTHRFGAYILIGAEISTSALFLSYIMWRSNFTIPHSFAAYIFRLYLLLIFAAYICRIHFPPTFAAYICRIHFPPTFAAYICRTHFPPIF